MLRKDEKKRRLAYVFRRTVKSIGIATFATFFALISCAYTPIMPMEALGAWGAIFVIVNFLTTTIMMPSYILIYEDYILVCIENLGRLRRMNDPRNMPPVNSVRPFFEAYMIQRHIENFFEKTWSPLLRKARFVLAIALAIGMLVAMTEPHGKEILPLD